MTLSVRAYKNILRPFSSKLSEPFQEWAKETLGYVPEISIMKHSEPLSSSGSTLEAALWTFGLCVEFQSEADKILYVLTWSGD